MEGGDLATRHRQHGGFLSLIGKVLGLGPGELMADPVKAQMLMQRGGLSIENQMKAARDPMMQRGGVVTGGSFLKSIGLPLLTSVGEPCGKENFR